MKRVASLIIAIIMILGVFPLQSFAQDVDEIAEQIHCAYVSGMPDGTFHPLGSLTRAELAQMLYGVRAYWPADEEPTEDPAEQATEEATEVLTEAPIASEEEPTQTLSEEPPEQSTAYISEELTETGQEEPSEESSEEPFCGFEDVPENAWFAEAVNALGNAGILHGCGDGLFHPNDTASRAEIIQVIVSVSGIKEASESCTFSDLSDLHWAYNSICIATQQGWVSGYTDGTCHPNNPVTRAEAVSIINRFLERHPDKAYINEHPGVHFYPDVQPGSWYYYDVAEASITHTPSESPETWTEVSSQPLLLSDGFYIFGNGFFFVKDGSVLESIDSSYQGVSFHCAATGICTVEMNLSVLQLVTGLCIVKNGKPCLDVGYCYCGGSLYYIQSSGLLLCSGAVGTMRFDKDGKYTSGNLVIDEFVFNLIHSVTDPTMTQEQMLRACYDYVQAHIVYQSINSHVPRGADESTWTQDYMLRLIERGKGNCFCFASEMYYIARALGYAQARAISGGGSTTGVDLDHGWLEIELDGIRYLFDPEVNWKFANEQPGAYFKKQYGTTYFKYFPPF